MRTPLAAALASLALAAPAAAHHLTWVESLVAGGPGDQYDAHISSGGIVYTDTAFGDQDVRAVTRLGNVSVASGMGGQTDPDASGDTVVFASDADGESDVFAQDLSTGIRQTISASASPETSPAISGGRVVFLLGGNLVAFNLTTGATNGLVPYTSNPSSPDIDGDLVAWQQSNGTDADIWATHIGQVPFLVAATGAYEYAPSVSGHRIAYLAYDLPRPSIAVEIHVYDTETGIDSPITNDGQLKSSVVISGDLLTWTAAPSLDDFSDIFVHDLRVGETVSVVTPASQTPSDLDGEVLIFQDSRFGRFDVRRLDLSVRSCTAMPPTSGLVGFWPMSSNADDWSGNGLDGTPTNGPTLVDDREVPAGAYHFDGVDDEIDVGSDPALRPPLPVTVSAWVKHECTGVAQFCPIFANDAAGGGLFGVRVSLVNTGLFGGAKLRATFSDGGGGGSAGVRLKTGTTALPAGVWTHVAAVLRGPGDISLYVNGVEVGGTYGGTGGPLAYAGTPAVIGRGLDSISPLAYFDGTLDEVTLYDRALGPGEIRALMDPCAPVSVPVAGPLGLGLLGLAILGLGTGALRWRAASRDPGAGPPATASS